MFSREELIHIYEHVTDSSLKRKIHARLFVDDEIIDKIKNIYSNDNLFRIEKSPYQNTYYVHLFRNLDTCWLIEQAIELSNEEAYEGLNLEIAIITHEDIEHIWHRENYTQVFYVSPEQFLV